MNVQDRLAEIFLAFFDALMNIITLGLWNIVRGKQRPNLKIKGK